MNRDQAIMDRCAVELDELHAATLTIEQLDNNIACYRNCTAEVNVRWRAICITERATR